MKRAKRKHKEWCGDVSVGRPVDECTCHITYDMQLTQQLCDAGPAVCVTHRRFVPCRSRNSCVISTKQKDIDAVTAYQKE